MNKSQIKLLALIVIIGVVALYFQNIKATKERMYRLNTECARQASVFEKEKNEKDKGITVWQALQTTFSEKGNSCFAEFASGPNFIIYNLTKSKVIIRYSTFARDEQMFNEYMSTKKNIFGNEK